MMNKALMAAAVMGLAAAASAAVVPTSARIGSIPSADGTGLQGTGYYGSASSLAQAQTIASGAPAFSFLAKDFDYNSSSASTPISDFLDNDANGLPSAVRNHAVQDTVYKFVGAIAIHQTGTYNFKITSDDGFRLRIGGQTIAEFLNDRSSASSTGTASFSQTGLYLIEILYYNNEGAADLKVEYGRGSDGLKVLKDEKLYPIPTPGVAAALGLGGLLVGRRRR